MFLNNHICSNKIMTFLIFLTVPWCPNRVLKRLFNVLVSCNNY